MNNYPPPIKKASRDNIYFGAFLGLIFPLFGFFLFYVIFFSNNLSIAEYFDSVFTNHTAAGTLALSLLLNLFVFFMNIWNHKYETAKGIVGMTMFYGIMVIIFKFA